MRVLLINDYATATGGAEIKLLELRDLLRARGHQVRLFSSRARPLGAELHADCTTVGTLGRARTLLQCANPMAAHDLAAELASFRPDVVHAALTLTQLSPWILRVLKSVPCIHEIVDYRPICPTGLRHLPSGDHCRQAVGAACYRHGCVPGRDWLPLMVQMHWHERERSVYGRTVVASEWMRQRLQAEGVGIDAVIPNAVTERECQQSASGAPRIAFAGRLVATKGVDVLLDAFTKIRKYVPDVRLSIAGDGPERSALQRRACSNGISSDVDWLGHLSPQLLDRAHAGAWVQAVPSTWQEPFGSVAAEAMMRGRAVVASRVGGLPEVLGATGAGHLVPAGDVAALCAALLDTLSSAARADEMGRAGRRRALRLFGKRLNVDRHLDQYRQLLAGAAHG